LGGVGYHHVSGGVSSNWTHPEHHCCSFITPCGCTGSSGIVELPHCSERGYLQVPSPLVLFLSIFTAFLQPFSDLAGGSLTFGSSAILASAAIPGVIMPIDLLMKVPGTERLVPFHSLGHKWRDGSFRTDIPVKSLQTYFNVNFTIVSQVNPHIVLFYFDRRGSAGRPPLHRHGDGVRGGFVLSSLEALLKIDMMKWLRFLAHTETAPSFLGQDSRRIFLQRFDGTITIVPTPRFSDYLSLISDPTWSEMDRKLRQGQLIRNFP
jgi:hypothetical protein